MQAAPLTTCGIKQHPVAAHLCQNTTKEVEKADEKEVKSPAPPDPAATDPSDTSPQRATRRGGGKVRSVK